MNHCTLEIFSPQWLCHRGGGKGARVMEFKGLAFFPVGHTT